MTGESVSLTLECSYNDWCVAQVAGKLNKASDYTYFMKRAGFYKNIFNPSKGLMWPKRSDGTWEDYDAYKIEYGSAYTEANAWQYNWSVQHDPEGLISLYKKKESFIRKLDSTFTDTTKPRGHVPDVSGLIGQYAHGNEPSHHVAYLYDFVGQPWKTQQRVKQIMDTQYDNTPGGLAGNEDCGQLSAWYIFSGMGFYPINPADGKYYFGTPAFKKVEIQLPAGKKFTINVKNISDKNYYIKAIKLNGKAWNKLCILHSDIIKGGFLEFEMTDKPNKKQPL